MHNEPYWEKTVTSLGTYDAVVVGAGFAGLSVASKLAQLGQRIVVLERSTSCLGASTRNAGFACFGSATELQRDIQRVGADAASELAATRLRGLLRLQAEFGGKAMHYEPTGGFELIAPGTEVNLGELNATLKHSGRMKEFEGPVYAWLESSHIPHHLSQKGYRVVHNELEGVLHPQHLHACMFNNALESGATVLFGHAVEQIAEGEVLCHVDGRKTTVQGEHVYVCTNGLDNRLTGGAVVPGRGQILVTEPWADNPYRGGWHMEQGYYYFREIEGRLLLGGGRQTDIQGETSTEITTTTSIQDHLDTMLLELLPEGVELKVDYRWAGIMGFTADGLPRIEQVSSRETHVCVCNGMGVALARELIYSEPAIGGAKL